MPREQLENEQVGVGSGGISKPVPHVGEPRPVIPIWTSKLKPRIAVVWIRVVVWDGPGFSSPLDIEIGQIVERDGFVFCECANPKR